MASTSIHKVIKVLHSNKYLQSYSTAVSTEFELSKNNLKKFFINKGFNNEQSEALTYSLRNGFYHISRDKEQRLKLEKKVLPIFKDKKKLEIKNLEALLRLRSTIKELSGNDDLFFKALRAKIVKDILLKSLPKSGGNILLRWGLTPLFWKLKDFEKGQSAQINLAYDLFNYYEMDDYGTSGENIGEIEQKDRIRTQFQQPAIKYFDKYHHHLGTMVYRKKAIL